MIHCKTEHILCWVHWTTLRESDKSCLRWYLIKGGCQQRSSIRVSTSYGAMPEEVTHVKISWTRCGQLGSIMWVKLVTGSSQEQKSGSWAQRLINDPLDFKNKKANYDRSLQMWVCELMKSRTQVELQVWSHWKSGCQCVKRLVSLTMWCWYCSTLTGSGLHYFLGCVVEWQYVCFGVVKTVWF